MWYITEEKEEGWGFRAIAMRVITDSLGHEHILLQRVGDNVPKLPLEVSGTEWDELVALVEADRTRRAAVPDHATIVREAAALVEADRTRRATEAESEWPIRAVVGLMLEWLEATKEKR